jgi:hypothetical protein
MARIFNGVVQVTTSPKSIYNPKDYVQGGSKVKFSYDYDKVTDRLVRLKVERIEKAGDTISADEIESLRVVIRASFDRSENGNN